MRTMAGGLLIFLYGCSEYEFKGQDNAQGADDTQNSTQRDTSETGTGGPGPVDSNSTDVDDCSDRLFLSEDLALVEECYVEEEEGSWTPVLEWNKASFGVDGDSNNVMMTPIVASLTDDNGDGRGGVSTRRSGPSLPRVATDPFHITGRMQ